MCPRVFVCVFAYACARVYVHAGVGPEAGSGAGACVVVLLWEARQSYPWDGVCAGGCGGKDGEGHGLKMCE